MVQLYNTKMKTPKEFWSVVLENGKSLKLKPREGCVLNVKQIALDVSSDFTVKTSAVVRVSTISGGHPCDAILGTLNAGTKDQMSIEGNQHN